MYKKSSSVSERIFAVCLVWFLPIAILLACGTQQKKSASSSAAASSTAAPTSVKFDPNGDIFKYVQSLHEDPAVNGDPSRARDRFDKMMKERREATERDIRNRREEFNLGEKSKRDAFLRGQSSARSSFVNGSGRKADSKTRSDFSSGQDHDRQAYFDAENARRHDFEDALREIRRSVDNGSRELSDQFNVEYRALVLRKQEASAGSVTGSGPPSPEAAAGRALLEEFRKIPKGPAIPLGPGVE